PLRLNWVAHVVIAKRIRFSPVWRHGATLTVHAQFTIPQTWGLLEHLTPRSQRLDNMEPVSPELVQALWRSVPTVRRHVGKPAVSHHDTSERKAPCASRSRDN